MTRWITCAILGCILTVASTARAHDDGHDHAEDAAAEAFVSAITQLDDSPAKLSERALQIRLQALTAKAASLGVGPLGELAVGSRSVPAASGGWHVSQVARAVLFEREFGQGWTHGPTAGFLLASDLRTEQAYAIAIMRRDAPPERLAQLARHLARSTDAPLRIQAARLALHAYRLPGNERAMAGTLRTLLVDREPAVAATVAVEYAWCTRDRGIAQLLVRRAADKREVRPIAGVATQDLGPSVGSNALAALRRLAFRVEPPEFAARSVSELEAAELRAWLETGSGFTSSLSPRIGRWKQLAAVLVDLDEHPGAKCAVDCGERQFYLSFDQFTERWEGREFRQSGRVRLSERVGDTHVKRTTLAPSDISEDFSPTTFLSGRGTAHFDVATQTVVRDPDEHRLALQVTFLGTMTGRPRVLARLWSN